ncbi:2'-5' RNA ligase [Streptomyces sp. DvalAA-14]|uniref:2'-5' RNA ligase family protein n=1 Tax=unclassified Streptomyces TaxID=2593676 RepID=UPI00081B0D27|nr:MULTISPECIES: 2'-5' RNA ligase family protein [unclassified Streptomyces]MYS20533.1 2'-5' RNA ligase family protein [Streptomyces sp. SID4948]SCD71172.1 2'-5' RNA ligase [Streptomyces sp. DvalAA-14]
MSDPGEPRWAVGETALLITVPEADPLVGGAGEAYDPAARGGVPAHVTVLYPFLAAERIDDGVLARLRELFCAHEAFDLAFARFGRFPELLWLAPEPAAPVRALTGAVEARWPEAPPYGGAFPDPVPHLTVADGQSPEAYDAMEREFAAGLPLRTRVVAVHLVVSDGFRWHHRATFPLGDEQPGGEQPGPERPDDRGLLGQRPGRARLDGRQPGAERPNG